MSKVSLGSAESAPVVTSPQGSLGQVETRAIFGRDRDPIHLHLHRLGPGASTTFTGDPTDRLLYVWEGAVEAGGALLGPRSSAIVEYGASLTVTAGDEGAALLAFGLRARSPAERAGGRVHLLPDAHVPRAESILGKPIGMSLHADAQCPTCELWFHESDFFAGNEETALHSHSEDEVIFVRTGHIRLGNRVYGPGTALAIAAHTKYGFFSGPDGLSFVNFRGTSPTYRTADGTMVLDEAEASHLYVGIPKYLEPCAPIANRA